MSRPRPLPAPVITADLCFVVFINQFVFLGFVGVADYRISIRQLTRKKIPPA
jgi:hypothetical protein